MTPGGELGIAVDLGSSSINVSVLSLDSGEQVGSAVVSNPLLSEGPEVVSMLRSYVSSEPESQRLRQRLTQAVVLATRHACSSGATDLRKVKSAVVAGNSVTRGIFFGRTLDELTRPPYTLGDRGAILQGAGDPTIPGFPDVTWYSPPCIESFVGSDAVCVLLYALNRDDRVPLLVVDIGTNTEVSVCRDDCVWTASAASGPAFEGMAMECGMPATVGAIWRVRIPSASSPPLVDTIDGGLPQGLCGTGAVSLLGELRLHGIMNAEGSIVRSSSPRVSVVGGIVRYAVVESQQHGVYITQPDIRMLQLSKAAIAAAVLRVLDVSETQLSQVARVLLTGAFGLQLDLDAAYRIGLLPHMKDAVTVQVENAALRGAEMILTESGLRREAEEIVARARYVCLMDDMLFDEMVSALRRFDRIQ
ncbi:MAG: DUF4445 domain-containing protein [Candidatus Thorarchaeota archaeon]|nr:DUF4445 domain-containing protein [Candidatus Thorarchaeota archaeon]